MQIIDYTRNASSSTGKFVHITGPDDDYLVFSPIGETTYHAQVVSRFCRDRDDMSCTPTRSGEDASLDVPGWRVCGGGMFRLDRLSGTLRIWGSSKAYGAFDRARVSAGLQRADGWKQYRIQTGTV